MASHVARVTGVLIALATAGCAASELDVDDGTGSGLGVTTQALVDEACTEEQSSHVSGFLGEAMRKTNIAKTKNNGGATPALKARTIWFGTPNGADATAHREHIKYVLDRIYDRFWRGDYVINCDASHGSCDGFVARAQGTNTIRLCSGFWEASEDWAAPDGKTGVLLHEFAHFDLDTHGDWVEGRDEALELALTDPMRAIENADNYMYFIEDLGSVK